jgi:tetratricopeptide (TPR) repeat protein
MLSPSESSRFWIKRTLEHIADDTLGYMKLEAKKLFYFFSDYEMHYIASAYKEYKGSLSYPFMRYGVIVSFGTLGILLGFRHFKAYFLLYSVILVYLVSGMLFLMQSRYRTPAVPYLCLFAALGIFYFKELLAAKNYKLMGMAVVLVGMILLCSHFGYRSDIGQIDRWQRATKIHYAMNGRTLFEQQEYREAISELEECVAMVPTFAPAYNLLGRSYAVVGDYDTALSSFKKVIELAPGVADGYRNLGFIYLIKGDRAKARRFLSMASKLNPDDDKVRRTIRRLNTSPEPPSP